MLINKKLVLAVGVATVVGLGAAAAQHARSDSEWGERWLTLMNHPGDTDHTISKREFNTYMDEQFDKADANHDGKLTTAELGHLRAMLIDKLVDK